MPDFPGNLTSLEPIREYVRGVAERAGLSGSAIYNLCLAVDEIATNIVMHGYAAQDGEIGLEASIEGGNLRIALSDTSPGYGPDEIAFDEGELRKPLEEREPGGLGLFLARDSVDELNYRRRDGCNVHELIVRIRDRE